MKNKKILAATAAMAVMILSASLTACGQKDAAQTTQNETQTSAETETQVTSEAGVSVQAATDAPRTEASAPVKNEVLGEFTSVTLDGTAVDQEIFSKAKLTMVNVWGTFCGYCIDEMPDLGELNREYQDQGFQIVGILSDVTEPNHEDAVTIVETTKADYTHILVSESIYPSIAGVPVPTTIFLDEDGNQVGEIYAGAKNKEKWDAIIKDALEQVNH